MSVFESLRSGWPERFARPSEWPHLAIAATRHAFGSHTPEEPLLLKPEEVAHLLGLGRSKVYEMLAAGELPVTRIGTAVRVPRQDLHRWIAARTSQAQDPAA